MCLPAAIPGSTHARCAPPGRKTQAQPTRRKRFNPKTPPGANATSIHASPRRKHKNTIHNACRAQPRDRQTQSTHARAPPGATKGSILAHCAENGLNQQVTAIAPNTVSIHVSPLSSPSHSSVRFPQTSTTTLGRYFLADARYR